MVSYKHGAHAERVRRCASALKALGHDIWIDVEGSSIMGKMMCQPTIGDAMCKSIDRSSHVIVFVEPDYLTSPNCQREHDWATKLEGEGQLEVIYVMLDQDCTPHHRGNNHKSHKLWMYIGDKFYHECFDDAAVAQVADNISTVVAAQ